MFASCMNSCGGVKEVAGPDTFRESGALHAMQTRLNVGKKKKKGKENMLHYTNVVERLKV